MERRKIYGTIIGVLSFVLLLVGVTYAYFRWTSTDNNTNVNLIVSKGLESSIVYNQGTSVLETAGATLEAGFDYTDGINTTIEFWKKETSTKTIYGQISLEILNLLSATDTLDTNIAKTDTLKWTITTYNVNDSTEVVVNTGSFKGKSIGSKWAITQDFELNNYQTFYKIYLWIDLSAVDNTKSISGELISTEISAEAADQSGVISKLDNSGANTPDLLDNSLIPVMYDTSSSNWVVADVNNVDETYQWYDYDNKMWANAVLVNETLRNSLTKNSEGNYTPGQAIGDSESEGVLAFYVWIPRYKYKVWNINKVAGTDTYNAYTTGIDIEFEKGTATTGTITCNYDFSKTASASVRSEECSDSGTEGYYTHPAFTFGDDEITGFWMGKFEISSTTQTASSYGGGNSNTLTPRILPNVMSWRYNYVDKFWQVIYNMQATSNIYGLTTDRTVADSHMLTNMEWGTVAYLTHSDYGRCANNACTEVAKNDSGDGTTYYTNYTGRSSGSGGSSGYSAAGTYEYDDTTGGVLASTTGNIYGVYDMSGGAYEYVYGNMASATGGYTYYPSSAAGTSYYTYTGYEKYVTTYSYGTTNTNQVAYNRARLGDATSESMLTISSSGGWYSDYTYFPNSTASWFVRGGHFNTGTDAGVFIFSCINGGRSYYSSARVALASLN